MKSQSHVRVRNVLTPIQPSSQKKKAIFFVLLYTGISCLGLVLGYALAWGLWSLLP